MSTGGVYCTVVVKGNTRKRRNDNRYCTVHLYCTVLYVDGFSFENRAGTSNTIQYQDDGTASKKKNFVESAVKWWCQKPNWLMARAVPCLKIFVWWRGGPKDMARELMWWGMCYSESWVVKRMATQQCEYHSLCCEAKSLPRASLSSLMRTRLCSLVVNDCDNCDDCYDCDDCDECVLYRYDMRDMMRPHLHCRVWPAMLQYCTVQYCVRWTLLSASGVFTAHSLSGV